MTDSDQPPIELYSKVNLANIVKRLKAGKTLSTSERKALAEFEAKQSAGEWVKDTSALARELGLSRQAIYDARARYPAEAPAKHPDGKKENIDEWRDFCAQKLIGKDVATKTLADLKAELMREHISLARAKVRRENAETVSLEVVESMVQKLGQKWDLLLRLKLEVESGPRFAGKAPAEICAEGSVMLDEIREVVNAGLSRFKTDAIKASGLETEDDD